MLLSDLWRRDKGIESVVVGEVVDHDGRVLGLRRLIQRRWGWPKKAATMVADLLDERYGDADGFELPVSGRECTAYQLGLIEQIQGLSEALLEGIAHRAGREDKDAGKPIQSLTVSFFDVGPAGYGPLDIDDGGLTTAVLHAVANRLGVSTDWLRSHSDFNGGAGRLTVAVDVTELKDP